MFEEFKQCIMVIVIYK